MPDVEPSKSELPKSLLQQAEAVPALRSSAQSVV